MSRLHHTFAVEHAEQYGIECAILIHHFQFWIEQNQAMGKNFIDGRTWTYQTHKEIYAIYPYLSEDIVQRNLKKLVDEGVLVTANYNKSQLNKTLWYAFKNEKMFTKPQNCGMETAKLRNASRENAEYIRKDTKSKDTKERYTKQQQQVNLSQNAAAAEEKKVEPDKKRGNGLIKLKNVHGKDYVIDESELYRHMFKFPYSTVIVQQAINKLRETQDPVGNAFKLLESICKRLEEKPKSQVKPSKTQSSGPPKMEEKGTMWNEINKRKKE